MLRPATVAVLLLFAMSAAVSVRAADDYVIDPTKANHWAWQKPVRPPLPDVRDRAWARNPIDRFVQAKREAGGLTGAAPASRERLLRRVTFDLIGLPPTPAEIDAFVADKEPNAYEKVIDRLLASPHYGERWGRHWLDVARFAESNGYEYDETRPDAWRYRDYVIEAFNTDKPYDQFVRQQIAGDELYPDDPTATVATAFNMLGPDMTDASDQAQRRQNTLNDMTDATGLAFLGMTIECARCHDHKFEPIPQTDYYRLQAFFAPAVFRTDLPVAPRPQRERYDAALRAYQALIEPIQRELAVLEEPYRKKIFEKKLSRIADEAQVAQRTPESKRTAVQKDLVAKTNRFLKISSSEVLRAMNDQDRTAVRRLEEKIRSYDNRKPAPLPTTMGLHDSDRPSHTYVLGVGQVTSPGEEVQPGFPIILSPSHGREPARDASRLPHPSRRALLAQWIASPDNPLTARVMVNRIWQHHFGRGIVATPSDFGVRGEPPTHQHLLDWLAVEFAERGWSIKAMHKLMLLSATYRQSTHATAEALSKDPDNHLLTRMNHIRLEGEIIRDSLLAVSGRLNEQMGGPGVFPPIPATATKGSKGWNTSTDPRDHVRRSVYIFARRNLRFPFLESFDLPDSNASCPKREQSTTAPQALAMLNDADVLQASRALATRIEDSCSSSSERIRAVYRLALGRAPTATELQLALNFLKQSPFSEFCRGLLNVNEFVYLD